MKTVSAHGGTKRFPIRWDVRLLTAIVLVAIGLIAGGVQYSLHRAREASLADIRKRLDAQVDLRAELVTNSESQIRRKALFLASVPSVRNLLETIARGGGKTEMDNWRRRTSDIFLAFARNNPEILRLRLVGVADSGRELVRVDHRNGDLVAVPADMLERVGDQDYIHGTRSLRPGKVYLSGLNLFREHNLTDVSHMPTLRAGTPLHSSDGRLRGMIVVSMDAGPLLADFRKSILPPFEAYLTTATGDFLSHPRPEMEFGFDLGTRHRWQDEFEGGVPVTGPARWVRGTTARPGSLLVAARSVPLDSNGRGFQILATYPEWALNADLARMRNTTLAVAAGILLLGGFVFLLYLRFQNRAKRRIQDLNLELERQVRERTAEIESYSALQKTILDTAGYAILASDKQGIITLFNPAAEAMFGYTSEEVVGKMSPVRFRLPEELEASVAVLSKKIDPPAESGFQFLVSETESEVPHSLERSCVRKDGARLPVLLKVTTLRNEGGESFGYLAMVVDLSDRRKIEEALRARTEEAIAANRSKAEFLANMSHEIRTPLSAVLGLAQVLEARVLEPETRELVRKIRRAGGSLRTLIDDVLDYSKIEAGYLELENVPFRLDDVLDNLSTIMGTNAGSKNIELVIGAPPNGTSHLVGDALRLEQVLINLTGNAIKFTNKGSVSVSMDLLSISDNRATLRFSVCDTGIGISHEKQTHIFDSFSQADTSTTRRFGGTGLGLAISRRLVEKMGGVIEVRSEFGTGSEFRFTAILGIASRDEAEVTPMARLDVLVADDHEMSRDAIVAVASSIGWQTVAVESGVAAIHETIARLEAKRPFDVLLLDWKMPDLDGLSTVTRLRAELDNRTPPIVLLATAYSREELAKHPEAKNLDGILSKPVTGSSLFNAVMEARKRRGENPSRQEGVREKHLSGIRLLVVDDNEVIRDLMVAILTDEGAVVHLAENGESAVKWLLSDPLAVDIVLMDVQMPVMDGYSTARIIRSSPALAALPIVALSAGVFRYEQEAALEAGMNDFIPKPFQVDDLVAVIRRLVTWFPPEATLPENMAVAEETAMADDIDLAFGLAQWKTRSVFLAKLAKFAADHRGFVDELADHAAKGDSGTVAFALHKLKGTAAVLAMAPLAAEAEHLYRIMHEGGDPLPGLPALRLVLDRATERIEGLLRTKS